MGDEKQAAAEEPLIGQVFGGRYSMRALIGRGGVGLVYLAENTETGEDVVLKILSPDWSRNPEAVRRFKRESERLGGVRHPNIVRLLDSGQDSGRAYLVMEYLEGELLSDFITKRRCLDLHTFVPIAAQVLKGVGHAHSRGVMLRDIKPANTMLCERKGRANFVKLLDFGLAKLTRDEQPVTEEHVLGTAGYLAPEVIEGNVELDVRVDVFSLGALFYFMLSGRLPFEGDETATVFYKTIHNDPVSLHDVLPTDHSIPEGLIKLVHQCLAKDPASRPDDANAIVEELIDVVPASLFRLPKIAGSTGVPRHITGETPRAGYGNTGLVQLVGSQAVSGRHPAVPTDPSAALSNSRSASLSASLSGRPAVPVALPTADDTPHPEPVTLSHPSQDSHHTGPVSVQEPQSRGVVLGLAATVVVLAGGLVYFAVQRSGTSQDERGAMAAREASVASAGSVHETKGETATAVQADRDVLEADATHLAAAKKLETLAPGEAAPADPPSADSDPTPDIVYGPVEVGSRPLANLYIDGEAQGTTPFKGTLSVGPHTVRMTARGYVSWQGELKVLESGTEELRVRLVGKGRKRHALNDDSVAASSEPTVTPKPEATPESNTAPEVTPEAAPEPKAKKPNSVFLPTKDDSRKDGGGVFLPTKD